MSDENPSKGSMPQPRALPAAGWLGPLSALVLILLGVVAGQDALARWGVSGLGSSWLGTVFTDIDGLRAATWNVPAGVVLVLIGLVVLYAALKPRRRTHVQADGDADLWFTPTALEALGRDAAEGVPGVARVSVTSTRSAVRVRVATDNPDEVSGPVEDAVRSRLEGAGVSVSVKTHRYRSEGAEL